MKVILLHDVPKVGRKYEIKEVAAGHARNLLIPQKNAELATDNAIKRLESLKKKHEEELKVRRDLLLKNLKDLDGVMVTVTGKASEQGHLFAGLHRDEIAQAIKESTQLDVDPGLIVLEHVVKEVGEHQIEVTVDDESVTFTLNVQAA